MTSGGRGRHHVSPGGIGGFGGGFIVKYPPPARCKLCINFAGTGQPYTVSVQVVSAGSFADRGIGPQPPNTPVEVPPEGMVLCWPNKLCGAHYRVKVTQNGKTTVIDAVPTPSGTGTPPPPLPRPGYDGRIV